MITGELKASPPTPAPRSGGPAALMTPAREARAQWIEVFSRDRDDLGPGHAAQRAVEDIERYGPQAPPRPTEVDVHAPRRGPCRPPEPLPASPTFGRSPGISG